jgi:hypothetical protein
LRAAIVSVCDNYASGHGRRTHHGGCDFFGRFECNRGYRGSASAKKRAERAGSLSGRDHTRKKLNQFRAKWLVKIIGKSATHFFVIPRCKRRSQRTCIRTVFYRSNVRDPWRQNSPRAYGFDFKVRD